MFTNWAEYKSNWITTNQIKCWFLVRGENWSTQEKPLRTEQRNNKLNPHTTVGQETEPAPYWWKVSALTTAATLLSLSKYFIPGILKFVTLFAQKSSIFFCWEQSISFCAGIKRVCSLTSYFCNRTNRTSDCSVRSILKTIPRCRVCRQSVLKTCKYCNIVLFSMRSQFITSTLASSKDFHKSQQIDTYNLYVSAANFKR